MTINTEQNGTGSTSAVNFPKVDKDMKTDHLTHALGRFEKKLRELEAEGKDVSFPVAQFTLLVDIINSGVAVSRFIDQMETFGNEPVGL